jgi:hypothetical protein
VWSSDGRELAFVEAVYDFTWGVDEECNETYDTGNRRYYLAIVSTDHTAIGYRLTGNVDQPRIAWLAGSRLKLSDARGNSGERVFDLSTNPPKPIP